MSYVGCPFLGQTVYQPVPYEIAPTYPTGAEPGRVTALPVFVRAAMFARQKALESAGLSPEVAAAATSADIAPVAAAAVREMEQIKAVGPDVMPTSQPFDAYPDAIPLAAAGIVPAKLNLPLLLGIVGAAIILMMQQPRRKRRRR